MTGKFAAFCQSFDERHHLWLWLQHYVPAVGEENCHILWAPTLGDQQPEMAATWPKVTWHADSHPSNIRFDDYWMLRNMQNFQQQLLKDYDVVVMTDTDELLVPTDGTDFSTWLQNFHTSERPCVKARGYNVFEDLDNRGQLLRWQLSTYDKTLVTRVPLTYRVGFHQAWNLPGGADTWARNKPKFNNSNCTQFEPIVDLELAHMHYADFKAFTEKDYRRHHSTDKFEPGQQFPAHDVSVAEQFFRTGIPPWAPNHRTYTEMRKSQREPVPAHWKSLNTCRMHLSSNVVQCTEPNLKEETHEERS